MEPGGLGAEGFGLQAVALVGIILTVIVISRIMLMLIIIVIINIKTIIVIIMAKTNANNPSRPFGLAGSLHGATGSLAPAPVACHWVLPSPGARSYMK